MTTFDKSLYKIYIRTLFCFKCTTDFKILKLNKDIISTLS